MGLVMVHKLLRCIEGPELDCAKKMTLVHVAYKWLDDAGEEAVCYAGADTIRAYTKTSAPTHRAHIKALVGAGWLIELEPHPVHGTRQFMPGPTTMAAIRSSEATDRRMEREVAAMLRAERKGEGGKESLPPQGTAEGGERIFPVGGKNLSGRGKESFPNDSRDDSRDDSKGGRGDGAPADAGAPSPLRAAPAELDLLEATGVEEPDRKPPPQQLPKGWRWSEINPLTRRPWQPGDTFPDGSRVDSVICGAALSEAQKADLVEFAEARDLNRIDHWQTCEDAIMRMHESERPLHAIVKMMKGQFRSLDRYWAVRESRS